MLAYAALSAVAIVCNPVVEADIELKAIGEKCGGTCDSFGKCAEGLECYVEKPKTSIFSMAILMGGSSKAGVCVEKASGVEPTDGERRNLMPGGLSDLAIDAPEVVQAAKVALGRIAAESNSLDAPVISRIISARKQVVAGIKYTIELETGDNTRHRVEVLDQAWMTPRFSVIRHELMK